MFNQHVVSVLVNGIITAEIIAWTLWVLLLNCCNAVLHVCHPSLGSMLTQLAHFTPKTKLCLQHDCDMRGLVDGQ